MRTKNIDAIFMVRLRQKEFMHRLQTHTKRMVIESKRNSHYANVHSRQETRDGPTVKGMSLFLGF